jgi:hypothetical protein
VTASINIYESNWLYLPWFAHWLNVSSSIKTIKSVLIFDWSSKSQLNPAHWHLHLMMMNWIEWLITLHYHDRAYWIEERPNHVLHQIFMWCAIYTIIVIFLNFTEINHQLKIVIWSKDAGNVHSLLSPLLIPNSSSFFPTFLLTLIHSPLSPLFPSVHFGHSRQKCTKVQRKYLNKNIIH